MMEQEQQSYISSISNCPCNFKFSLILRSSLSVFISADFFLPRVKDAFPPSIPFRSRPINTARGLGERCKLPSRQTIWCILESTSATLVAAVFVDFHSETKKKM